MARAAESILMLWRTLSEEPLSVSSTFWAAWEREFHHPFEEMRTILNTAGAGELPLEKAQQLEDLADKLIRFLRGLKISLNGKTEEVGGALFVHELLSQLIRHHIGNDLYLITLSLDVDPARPQPLTPGITKDLLISVGEMGSFWEKIRKSTLSY